MMKDNLAAVEALGFTLPSASYLVGAIIFGIVGYIAYRYGKKMSLQATKWIGIALMLYPYAVSATWLLYVGGACLSIGAYSDCPVVSGLHRGTISAECAIA